MPISKRLRYEILRRDNHSCRYCGESAPDVKITVDHVMPVALGGTDAADNLVAACRDCNAGKSSVQPDAALVDDVKQADIKWAGAVKRVAKARERQRKRAAAYVMAFDDTWKQWKFGRNDGPIPRPADWMHSIERFYELGVTVEEMVNLVGVACGNGRVHPDETFRYFAGCMWRAVTETQEAAKALLESEAIDGA